MYSSQKAIIANGSKGMLREDAYRIVQKMHMQRLMNRFYLIKLKQMNKSHNYLHPMNWMTYLAMPPTLLMQMKFLHGYMATNV